MKQETLQLTPKMYAIINYEQLYSNKEMDKSLPTQNLSRLNKEIPNSPATSKEIEAVIKNLPPRKCPALDGFTTDFYKTFTEELTPIFSNYSKY